MRGTPTFVNPGGNVIPSLNRGLLKRDLSDITPTKTFILALCPLGLRKISDLIDQHHSVTPTMLGFIERVIGPFKRFVQRAAGCIGDA